MSSGKRSEAARCYRDFVENALGEEWKTRSRKVYGGMILGSKRFIKDALGQGKARKSQKSGNFA